MKLRLDPRLVWRLEESAEKAGMSLDAYVQQQLALKAKVRVRSDAGEATRREVARLHGEGFTDVEIAERVDRVQEHVARTRRALGLKPNRRRKVGA